MPLAALKQHMERTFRQLASEKGLAFEVEFSDDLPATIRTDEKRLQQVVLNLLSNAFKFTAAGGVTLAVRPVDRRAGAPTTRCSATAQTAIEISVSDTGIGIPQDKQKLIFEAFQQADGTTSRKYGGTGLGLSISREIARLLGGELQVRSVPGEGSTFTLYVPLQVAGRPHRACPARPRKACASDARVPAPLPLARRPRRPRRQAVRADRRGRPDLRRHPARPGARRRAEGRDFVEPARARSRWSARCSPSAITLDLGLSDIDGFVLLDLLAPRSRHRGIPVHVISGAEQAAHALTLGAAGGDRKARRPRQSGRAVRTRSPRPPRRRARRARRPRAPARRGTARRRSPNCRAAGSSSSTTTSATSTR